MSSRQERRALERKNGELRRKKELAKQRELERRNKQKDIKSKNKQIKSEKTKEIFSKHWKKLIAGFVCLVVVVAIVVGVSFAPKHGKYGQIIAGHPTLMDIGSTSCVPCQQLQPVLTNLGKKYDGTINISFYDCWNTNEGAKMAEKYNAVSIPTLVFLDGQGREVARMTGYNEQSVIEAKFRSLGWIT